MFYFHLTFLIINLYKSNIIIKIIISLTILYSSIGIIFQINCNILLSLYKHSLFAFFALKDIILKTPGNKYNNKG